jgi:hypothetical protein
MKYRKTAAWVALLTASALTRSIRADSTLYSSISGPTTTLKTYTALEVGGGYDGIGDDYTTNYASIEVTGMSFYGGLTRADDYLAIEFFNNSGGLEYVYTNGISQPFPGFSARPLSSESQGIGLHVLSAGDFNDGSQIVIPGSGYVVFAPISYGTDDLSTGVITQEDPNPPVFTLGFGQAPTIGSNNASISVLSNNYSQAGRNQVRGQVSTGAYVTAVTNQYAQFSITGVGIGSPINNVSSGTSSVWTAATSGNWEAAGNWQGSTISAGAGQTATFADSIGSAAVTVTLTANETVGSVIFNGSSGGAYTLGSNGINTLTLDNNGSAGVISVNAGSQTISAPISLASGLNITTTSGGLALGGALTGTGPVTLNASSSLTVLPAGAITLGVVDNGQMTFAAQTGGSTILARTIPTLTLGTGATLTLAAAPANVARQVLFVTESYQTNGGGYLALSLSGGPGSWTSKIDLANNDAIISDAAPYSLGTITNQVAQAYNGGNWQGSGGIVSSAAAADSTHLTALGVIRNDDQTNTDTRLFNTFDGVAVTDYDILIKYTYYGDANLSGKVDSADYTLIDNGYLSQNSASPLIGWYNGDFNYDGVINGSDYTLIDNAFNQQGAQISDLIASPAAISTALVASSGGSSAVPEPAAMMLFATASLPLLGRSRRAKSTL